MLSISICFRDDYIQLSVVDDSGFSASTRLESIDEILEYIQDFIDQYEY